MSDTQGSHRRAGLVPEAYGAELPAWTAGTADPGATLPDPDAGVPAPRAGSRRAGRRRRGADAATGPGRQGDRPPAELAELAAVAELAELAELARLSEADTLAAPGSGRRRAAGPAVAAPAPAPA
ncbi:hypothetical protein PV721_42475, partial [Streptomyces sp. MB09-01]|nr:hypothetical protein [Streptomyces sp. MB09-01]